MLRRECAAMDPVEGVRQTLMTHMWANMARKPSGISRGDNLGSSGEDGEEEEEDFAVFPVTFAPPVEAGGSGTGSEFPDVDELRRQLPLESEREGSEVFPLGEEEYARLDEWLDDDDDDDEADEFVALPEEDLGRSEEDVEYEEVTHISGTSPSDKPGSSGHSPPPDLAFEDDFDDFAPFQTAPAGSGEALLSLDPTPLLWQRQAVGVEGAGGEDEEERRVRAGREVERVMRDMGMGMGGMGDLEDLGGMGDLDDLWEEDELGGLDERMLGSERT